jgi:hypothetical protein
MKAIFFAQFSPRKTLEQLIHDRDLFRLWILAALVFAWCA